MVNITILTVSIIMTSRDTLFVNLDSQLKFYDVFYLQKSFLSFKFNAN